MTRRDTIFGLSVTEVLGGFFSHAEVAGEIGRCPHVPSELAFPQR
jgi:hypothetical protein